ncbi:MAG TPA: DUF3822 family protein [Bacteroidales bacterium]|nr:DUF3822 family protein [Bacteroidales bacterium]
MPFLELFDETLDINSTENYELSVQVSPDGLSFSLLDTIRNKFVMIRSSEPEENRYFNSDKINELIGKDDFLTKHYKKVNIIMPSKKFTIVPAPLFDPAKKDDYFLFNHNNEEGNAIIVNKLTNPDAYLIFSVSKPILSITNNNFKGVYPYHHLKPLLEHISHNTKIADRNYISIHVERDFFNLIIFSNKILKFCNTFAYRNISDILYFVLNVFRKLDVKQDETVYFSGKTEKYDDLSSSFAIYVRNIKFSEPSGNFTFSYVFNDMELHRFLNLFTVTNCE